MTGLLVRRIGPMGRGVFAARRFRKGEVIELCPVIPMETSEEKHLERTVLRHYIFAWGPRQERPCVVLGFGSLYNHSLDPNADFEQVRGRTQIKFFATRDIKKGEQIFIDYGWEDQEYVAFASREAK